MAASWLALGGQNKAIDNLLARWGIAEPIGTMGLAKRQTDRASFRGDSDLCWLCRTRRCCGKEQGRLVRASTMRDDIRAEAAAYGLRTPERHSLAHFA